MIMKQCNHEFTPMKTNNGKRAAAKAFTGRTKFPARREFVFIRVHLWLALLSVACAISASTLRPSTIVYGVIRDSYGLRLPPDSAFVGAFFGTNETARTTIRPQPAGANYRFDVNVSDPMTAGPKEVTPGAAVSIRVRMGNVLQSTIGNNSFTAQGNGGSANINLVLGVDTDGDGLPDDWEWLMIANSGGLVSSLSQIGPGRDLDRDGVPDDQEFWNGTFAFLPDDLLRLESLSRHANGRLSFSFLPIQGATYSVEFTPGLETPAWTLCPISLTETGPVSPGTVTAGTQWITLYVEPGSPKRFWRLRRQ
jgi:hypothetical protein